MKFKRKRFEELSPLESLILRDRLGLKRYKKTIKRDEFKKRILLKLGLMKIHEQEKDDFISVGFRRRRVRIFE